MKNKKELLKEFDELLPKGCSSISIPLHDVHFERSYDGVRTYKKDVEEFKKKLERFERIFELGRLLQNEGMKVFEFHAREEKPHYNGFITGIPLEINPFYWGPGVMVSNPSYMTTYTYDDGEEWIGLTDSFLEDPIVNIINDIAKLKKDLQEFENFVKEWI